ncbi:MAG: hypothetical protein ACREK5_10730 [Gemmatimonadota bacterium]
MSTTDFLGDLLERWEAELRVLQACGASEAAATRETDIRELREWYLEFQLEELTLEQGAEWSGLSYDGLRKKVERGEIPNAGEKGRPRVRRSDLPMKPQGIPEGPDDASGSIAGRILAARRGR